MRLSKIWLCLVVAAATVCFGLALLVPKPASREIATAQAESLDRKQQNAELMLRLESRNWIDTVAKLAADGVLVDGLEQATSRRGDMKGHQARISGRLLSLVSHIKAEMRPQLLIAVDYRGKQIARVGVGEDKVTPGEDGLAGYPLVEAALRGYRGDDTWSLDGNLYLMAASPVLGRSRARYVGALLLGTELNEAFARRLKGRLTGTDLAFFLRGRMVASTIASPGLGTLPGQFSERRPEIAKFTRSAAIRVGEQGSAYSAILAALPGEAAGHDAFYAVIGIGTSAMGLDDLRRLTRKSDLAWAEFPWLLLGGALLVTLVVGVGLMVWEVDVPAQRFRSALVKLAQRELQKFPEEQFSGNYGAMGHAVNALLERALTGPKRSSTTGKEAAPSEIVASPGPPMGTFLPEPAMEAPGVQPLRGISGDFRTMATPPPLAVQESPSMPFAEDSARLVLSEIGVVTHGTSTLSPLSTVVNEVEFPQSQSLDLLPTDDMSLAPLPGRPAPAPLRSTSGAAAAFNLEPGLIPPADPSEAAPAPRRFRIPSAEDLALGPALSSGAPSAASPPPVRLEEPAPASLGLPPLLPPDDVSLPVPRAPSAPSVPAPPLAAPAADPQDESFRQTFRDFLTIKRQCGENVSNLTFERFAEKLRSNRDALVARYHCKSVKFQVYVKDGKAALKATPVKE
jgi:hypothetical protein